MALAMSVEMNLVKVDWEDLQITGSKHVVDAPRCENIYEVGFIENVGSAESQGVEAAISVRPTKGLTFTSSAYWGDARTTEDFSSTSGDVPAGSRLPVSPHFQIANHLTYVTDDWRGWQAGFGITHAPIGRADNNLLYKREQGG